MNFENIIPAIVTKRPSKICKSPYMADIIINEEEYLAHSPSLGCSGLVDAEKQVFVTELSSKNTKSSHKIMFSLVSEMWEGELYNSLVCTHPHIAETIVEHCLKENLFDFLKVKNYKSQVTFENSRFDFCGVDDNDIEFILEVKSVPVADYHNVNKQTKKKMIKNNSFVDKHPKEKIAIFPDGYIKPSKVPIPQSERANKHILELTNIKQNTNKRTIMVYVVQRSDANMFVISELDTIYKENVKIAKENGVELYYIQMHWKYENNKIQGNIINTQTVNV